MTKIIKNDAKYKNLSLTDIGILNIIFGSALGFFTPYNFLPYTLMGLKLKHGFYLIGMTTILYELLQNSNKYNKLFKVLELHKNNNYPIFKSKEETEFGYRLVFKLPFGMSQKDFENKKIYLRDNLKARDIIIRVKNGKVVFNIFDKDISGFVKFRKIKAKKPVEVLLGETFGESTLIIDLSSGEPHALIAGATGSGKSTIVRAILTHFIINYKEGELVLHLIDLKRGVEFGIFKDCNIVKSFAKTEIEAIELLKSIVEEVNRRYDLFYKYNCKDIKEYNSKVKNKLNYQVIVIDEYSLLSKDKDATALVEKLTAIARACGIHLIIATQRPSVDVINGTIKANVSIRVGLKTSSSTDSRIIIDESGLEDIEQVGRGYLKKDGKKIEFQGMFLDVDEARSIIKPYENKKKEIKKKEVKSKKTKIKRIKKETNKKQTNNKEINNGEILSFDFFKKLQR